MKMKCILQRYTILSSHVPYIKKNRKHVVYEFENISWGGKKTLEIQQTTELTQEYKSKEILDGNSAAYIASTQSKLEI